MSSKAQKYKDYQLLQDHISGKVPPSSKSESQSQSQFKRNHEYTEPSLPRPAKRVPAPTQETPKKRRAIEIIHTPSQQRIIQPSQINPYDSPSAIRNLFTPQKPVAIGPTPQKDGKLLGLFDLLPEDDSPVKEAGSKNNATPSKGGAEDLGDLLATPSGAKHSRTPRSSSKRFLLDAFMTPLKRRLSNSDNSAKKSLTPSSISKLNFATPLFLRRDNPGARAKLEAVMEVDEEAILSPEAPTPRGPRRPLVRGLSSMLASLREMQDGALDEDEEAMREMEGGGGAPAARPLSAGNSRFSLQPKSSPLLHPDLLPEVLVQDSQRADNPFIEFPDLDFNKDIRDYEDGEEGMNVMEKLMVESDSKLAVYKKKGQKRMTRRHNMKPVALKKTAAKSTKVVMGKDDDIPGDEEVHDLLTPGETSQYVDIIPDTQVATFTADSLPLYESKRNFDSESEDGTEYTASIGGTRYKRAKRPSDYKTDADARKQKVGAQVHTNYQRLKIRGNTGMKGKSVGGRFGKRR